MDKIPLPESIGIDLWNTESLETCLFDSLLCEANISESTHFLKTLDNALDLAKKQFFTTIKKEFWEAVQCNKAKQYPEALQKLDNVISKAPKVMIELKSALVLRADMFHSEGNVAKAILDYEICVHLLEINEMGFILPELTILTEMYGKVGDYEKFVKSLEKLKFEYSKHSKQSKSKKNLKKHPSDFIKQFGDHINDFEKNLKLFTIQRTSTPFKHDENKLRPYEGYKGCHDPRISSASIACTLSKNSKKQNCVLANRFIPLNEIVILENCGLDHEFYSPDVHCDYCLQTSSFMYSCLECRFKSYCSFDCMQSDYHIHKYECFGYKTSFLLMLNAGLLYRLFIRTLMCMKKYVFDDVCNAEDIDDFFEMVLTKIKTKVPDSKLKKVLTTIPDYEKLNCEELLTMATFAVRISVFVVERTKVLDEFFNKLKFSKEELMIFISGLLLRLQYQIKVNTIEMNFSVKNSSRDLSLFQTAQNDKFEKYKLNPTNGLQNIFEHYKCTNIEISTNARNVLKQFLTNNQKKVLFKSNKTSKFARKIYRLIVNEAFTEQTNSNAVQKYDIEQKSELILNTAIILLIQKNFFSLNSDGLHEQTMEGIYPTTRQFQHSCEPNVAVILLQSGSIMAKTIRDIEPGEELCISYGPNFKDADQKNRKSFLEKVFIDCNCQHCICRNDFYERNNTVYCYNCRELIEDNLQCDRCNTEKAAIQRIYDSINQDLKKIEEELENEDNEEKIFKHFVTKISMYYAMYPETSRKMFKMKMKFAQLCTYKNFVFNSIVILKNLVIQAEKTFPAQSSSLMINYFKISEMLMHILNYNLTFNIDFVKEYLNSFYDIVFYTVQLIQIELDLHEFLEIFDNNTLTLLNNYQVLMAIKHTMFLLEYPKQTKNLMQLDKLPQSDIPKLYQNSQLIKGIKYLKVNYNDEDLKSYDILALLKSQILSVSGDAVLYVEEYEELEKDFGNLQNCKSNVKIKSINNNNSNQPQDLNINFLNNDNSVENSDLINDLNLGFSFKYDGKYIIITKEQQSENEPSECASNSIQISKEVDVENSQPSSLILFSDPQIRLTPSKFVEEVNEYFCNKMEERHKLEKENNVYDFERDTK